MREPLFAAEAWIEGRWQRNVLLEIDAGGCWSRIQPDAEPPPGVACLPGRALPGLVDAHSHAFQRAFAGLAERRTDDRDDFWSWRDRMYGVALRITPEQLRAIAAQLNVELLLGGYTQVCEFHYLHHAIDGSRHADPAAMAHALADAAGDAGIGLTVLPVLYERAGFAQPALRDDQRRFAASPGFVRDVMRAMQARGVGAGVAIHSLRAASAESIRSLMMSIDDEPVPIHIHVSEQTQEVDDCVAALGSRPIEWLCRELRPDHRWQLVHATHAEPAEIDAVAASGAGIVICPTTEANLGDGLADLPRWLAAGVPLSIGSDSQVSRRAVEELRWLEYGQRLARRQRNVAASPSTDQASTAARLFDAVSQGAAIGRSTWGLRVGARADLVVLDDGAAVPRSHALDAWMFATDPVAPLEAYVAGQRVVAKGAHVNQFRIAVRFARVMAELWPEG